ncbi:MAG: hypothetical protein ACRDZN_12805 [Acidimicrobiales bacterium]
MRWGCPIASPHWSPHLRWPRCDTILSTIPNHLGVEYDRELLANIAEHVAPGMGWTPAVIPSG